VRNGSGCQVMPATPGAGHQRGVRRGSSSTTRRRGGWRHERSGGGCPPSASCLAAMAQVPRRSRTDAKPQTREQREVRLGGGLVFLLLREDSWIHRRVENFSFVDDETARRQMSVDFTLPLTRSRLVDDLYRLIPPCVPLTMLNKEPLKRFSIFDESGVRLPVLSTAENGALAGAVLVGAAEIIARRLGSGLPAAVANALRQLALLPAGPAESLFRCLHLDPWQQAEQLGPAWAIDQRVIDALEPLSPHIKLIQELLRSGPLRVLAAELSRQFILFAQFAELDDLRRRRLVKFVYDEPLVLPRVPVNQDWLKNSLIRVGSSVLESVSWSAKTFTFSGVAAGHAPSHHVEIQAPPEMELLTAALRSPGLSGRVHSDRGGPDGEVVHLQVSGVPRESRGTATVRLRAKRSGLLRAAPLLGWLTTVALLYTRAHLRQIDRSAGTALLLSLPAVLAAFVARPGEHALVTQSLIGVRLCVLGIGLCSAGVAVGLAVGVSGHGQLREIWSVAADAAAAISGALTASWLLPRSG
jgi:hypothetical protein